MTNKTTSPHRSANRVDRATNVQLVLRCLRSDGPSTQAAIARAVGLSRATVNQIVQKLRDEGVVEYQWKNQREALITLASTQGVLASVIVRESSVHAILFDFTRKERMDFYSDTIEEWRGEPSSPEMVGAILKRITHFAKVRGTALSGVAIAMEGPVERSSGAIAPWAWHRLPHWKGVNIAGCFSRLRIPVVVDNDANLAALAEWTWGVGRGCDHFLHITSSAGIGGGIIVNGRVYHGGTGLAGEIGHLVIEKDGPVCFCGSRGCLTSFATEQAILRALANTARPKKSLADVINSAHHGDAACRRVLSETGVLLGRALATVVRVIAPNIVAIGGTLGYAGDFVLDGVQSAPEVINLRAIGDSAEFKIAAILEYATELGGLAAILSELNLGTSSLLDWMVEPRNFSSSLARDAEP